MTKRIGSVFSLDWRCLDCWCGRKVLCFLMMLLLIRFPLVKPWRRNSDGSPTDLPMSKYKGSSEIGRSSVGVHRSVGSLGEGERSEANSSPRDPSVLLSLGKSKNDGSGSDCFKREISNFGWKLRRCFLDLEIVQVVVFTGNHNGNLLSSVGHRRTTDGSRRNWEKKGASQED